MKESQKSKGALGQNLYRVLLHKIVEGDLKAREQLPSERMLSEGCGVHRGVVREALKRLEAQKIGGDSPWWWGSDIGFSRNRRFRFIGGARCKQ
ncbi:MAG: GntR family transcriptional regulator [Gammaproteobacteria bacterium]|nr:GntR family transcriptional regulator [Gammaproteobacteria bacterium]